jgi:hypothetical protein
VLAIAIERRLALLTSFFLDLELRALLAKFAPAAKTAVSIPISTSVFLCGNLMIEAFSLVQIGHQVRQSTLL